MISVAVLLAFFVPLLVVIARNSHSTPAQASRAAAPVPPLGLPPLPPPGAPWPPPAGAPVPPVCSLEYRVNANGSISWTALTTAAGVLIADTGATENAHRRFLRVPVGVEDVALPAALARDRTLHAVLTSSSGRTFTCLVGAEVRTRPQTSP
jgi:hypothetical protein